MNMQQYLGWTFQLISGAAITAEMTIVTAPLGFMLGMIVALAKESRHLVSRLTAEAVTTVFRGTPELLTLLLIYYGAQMLLNAAGEHAPLLSGIEIPPFAAGAVALTLVAAAYSSENFLAAIRALERGQLEAAKSFGMHPVTTFFRISLPQILRTALPSLGNNCLNILKDTSLVSIIALEDLMRKSYLASGNTKQPILFFFCACVVYLAMSGCLVSLFALLERRFSRGSVRRV
ncbi:ABC transporter permease subunit [bacterium M00.F.Ca.ET.228.01.1.1]|uniref:ABC transporter permease n=1 Tax=Paraburkholderia phenoliruptrix TaxID=252970 RepID=UPI0010930F78|nr:ABC transporter permease subunit [Paraburkholderia phenoliruptrix]TGP48049.1 ABC transporter permease subunit [bacterium M00.F.Ca.ET.228.01.1.1]TGS05841.1 ABC transporter permease subunit [bacterium M00.F.Ca.ET.191.01.1.1]TGU10778.1 ABC transporter permease subunit [bacterium M00.F.Ca.ET.155.01.1.1]MBW0445127.1 ABC transporter permease subunit [Paraburkholderia phenoliruptrix]MBW9095892.1 ABC transporter permease subunit [Paraburkholderia phenoliruptrix]